MVKNILTKYKNLIIGFVGILIGLGVLTICVYLSIKEADLSTFVWFIGIIGFVINGCGIIFIANFFDIGGYLSALVALVAIVGPLLYCAILGSRIENKEFEEIEIDNPVTINSTTYWIDENTDIVYIITNSETNTMTLAYDSNGDILRKSDILTMLRKEQKK